MIMMLCNFLYLLLSQSLCCVHEIDKDSINDSRPRPLCLPPLNTSRYNFLLRFLIITSLWLPVLCNCALQSLWPPYVIGQAIMHIMLIKMKWNYIFALWFLLISSFFSLPNLSRRRLDVCHTSTHGVALVQFLRCRSKTCYTWLAENTRRKK